MSEIEFNKELATSATPIEGLVVYELPVHGDSRGWFKENWQREKMVALGLPDFSPVQNNFSFNVTKGVTRGLHAEPWDKFVSIGAGRVFGAWCDLRGGSPTFGQSFTIELDASKAIYVPRGVANGFQTLEDNTVYMYLVNDHWSPDGEYAFVNVADPELNINWPIPLSEAELSDKDRQHPMLVDAKTIQPKKVLITGANGQLGQALQLAFPDSDCIDRDSLDISSDVVFDARHWRDYGLILNAAAYTAVDSAETSEGRIDAWKTNAYAVANLARIASDNNITLVHVSSDYVFDGTQTNHSESEAFSPLSVYGESKAAGDIAASTVKNHYVLRTSWVIGRGNNFIKTMRSLAEKGVKPTVVDDQVGRLTFTKDLAAAIQHLVDTSAPYGTYNMSNSGNAVSWADIATEVYSLAGHDPGEVSRSTTAEYYAGKEDIAPRPLQSTLDLSKLEATGFTPRDWRVAFDEYWQELETETN